MPTSPASQPFPVPYKDNFDLHPLFSEAPYFADQAGSWEIVATADPSRGRVMRQMVRARPFLFDLLACWLVLELKPPLVWPCQVPMVPITWEGDYAPYSVIGDVKWSDVSVSVDVKPDAPGAVCYLGVCLFFLSRFGGVLMFVCVCVLVLVHDCACVRMCVARWRCVPRGPNAGLLHACRGIPGRQYIVVNVWTVYFVGRRIHLQHRSCYCKW